MPSARLEGLLETLRGRREQRAARRAIAELHVCPACDSQLVYPTDWSPAGRDQWAIDLRCPECEWIAHGTFDQEVVDRFDLELDDGVEQILDDLTKLTRANMEEEVERFIAALDADTILPEDF